MIERHPVLCGGEFVRRSKDTIHAASKGWPKKMADLLVMLNGTFFGLKKLTRSRSKKVYAVSAKTVSMNLEDAVKSVRCVEGAKNKNVSARTGAPSFDHAIDWRIVTTPFFVRIHS